ncbi:Non-structural polyprotein 1AB [Rhizoctonia solani]|uniref:Non-structural polyprotein 1AB n=1 Tax=Rhizoctonia solani TaxID=456999 RepID=A0A0K6FSN2_9AGAM|nr:Non-structural polyprotein 1AB [Rhizoctonia solani]
MSNMSGSSTIAPFAPEPSEDEPMLYSDSEDSRPAGLNLSTDTTTTMPKLSPVPAPDRNGGTSKSRQPLNSSTDIEAAVIREQIQRCRKRHNMFQDLTELGPDDGVTLLFIVLSGSRFKSLDIHSCKTFVWKNDLGRWLRRAYEEDSYKELCDHLESLGLPRAPNTGTEAGPVLMARSGSNDLKGAFETIYRGNLHKLFKDVMNMYARLIAGAEANESAYNKSVTIIQSSGMGKSRLVDETSKLIATLPINIREDLGATKKGGSYPPADENLRKYFEYPENESDQLQQARHIIFLTALFDFAAPNIEKYRASQQLQALGWRDHLRQGETSENVGSQRKDLYDEVVRKACEGVGDLNTNLKEAEVIPKVIDIALTKTNTTYEKIDTLTKSDVAAMDLDTAPTKPDTTPEKAKPTRATITLKIKDLADPKDLEKLYSKLRLSLSKLVKVLAPEKGRHKADNMLLVYFDEAHGLTKPPSQVTPLNRMSSYHNLGKVLAELCKYPVCFVFLSTNSDLHQFAPPPSDHPSVRVSQGHTIIPPFTELPFDVFVQHGFETMTGGGRQVTLRDVCTTDTMSCFGRPMWHTHHDLWVNQHSANDPSPESERVDHVLSFAKNKISAHGTPEKSSVSELAALGIRVGIEFDSRTRSSRRMEAKHVESHMRVVYAIPKHREYMRTGTPSEPILAEAAAFYLAKHPEGLKVAGPKILADSCRDGFIARGERGELCGRLLLTIAHDLALALPPKLEELDTTKPNFHVPIPVLDFLRALFEKSHHETVLKATPLNSDFAGSKNHTTLEKAFENAYVSFSHFELADDSDVLEASQLRYSLIRGCAIQAKEGQDSIDAVIPIHIGDVTDPITTKTMSAINVQFKNRKQPDYCAVKRKITVPDPACPVISIVFELGFQPKDKRTPLVEVQRAPEGDPQDPSNDFHYQILTRGHGAETFNAVDSGAQRAYDMILGTGDLINDFPRASLPGSLAYLHQMRPLRREYTLKHLGLLDPKKDLHLPDSESMETVDLHVSD